MQPDSPEPGVLPQPDEDSARHCQLVVRHIQKQIENAGGDISFAEFMQHALYTPGLGYYSAGATKLGAAGDFVTAPEISEIFGQILARQCADVLRQVSGASILELGAGSGALAVTLLQRLAALDELPEQYFILDVSADLVERQKILLHEKIPELADRVVWLSELPANFRGVVVANEVVDALPVERFRKTGGVPLQCRVAIDAEQFSWRHVPAPEKLQAAIDKIEVDMGHPFADDYESEISPGLYDWIADLKRCMETGFVFIFDYGVSRREYYAADRSKGWLRCHFRHHVHDNPLVYAGIQDLTAWVDFTSVAEAGIAAGLELAGYVSQAHFLIGGGLEEELGGLESLPVTEQVKLSQEVKLLTLPSEMGENFKCMGLSLGDVIVPSAFSLADRRHAL